MPSTRTANWPSPAVMPTTPARSFVPVAPRNSISASTPFSGTAVGTFLSTTLTTPPMAPPPYSSVAGPRSTSMRSASSGSTVTAWSGEMLEASITSEPSDSTFTRGAVWPRITGRLAPPPNVSLLTPGRLVRDSPSVPLRRSISSLPSNTEAGSVVLLRSKPSGLADTVIGAKVLARLLSTSVSACATGAISISEHTSGFRLPRRAGRAMAILRLPFLNPSFLPFIVFSRMLYHYKTRMDDITFQIQSDESLAMN
ncbi:hypothetical protein D3C72_537690 [compost metagenome]